MSNKEIQRKTLSLLHTVTAALPQAEERQGQNEMAVAIALAVDTKRHLIVQAGTGTGKTLGYLVPLIASGKRVVVSTYTKALQDQLAANDLPLLSEVLGKEQTRWDVKQKLYILYVTKDPPAYFFCLCLQSQQTYLNKSTCLGSLHTTTCIACVYMRHMFASNNAVA